MKSFTIICITKANSTEYLHAVTVEAENVTEAKKAAAEQIEQATGRHAFTPANITTAAAARIISWTANRWNVTASEIIDAARAPQGLDRYAETMPATKTAEEPAAPEAEQQTTAERIAEQARDYYQDTIYSAISPADVEKADAYTNEHLRLTVEVMDTIGIFHASDRMLVAIAHAMRWTLDDIEVEAMEQAHEVAARQLISAYAEAIGDTVTEDDPEAIAAHQVAREAIGYTTATEEQRATVDAMVEAIADRATQDADEARYTRAEQDAAQDWQGEGWYSVGYSDGATDDNPHYWEGRDELASEYAEMYRTATAANLPTCEYYGDGEEPADLDAGQYQRHELEAFLGDYVSAYDVDAIEAEATTYVYSEAARYWRKFIDLAAIAERHEISA